MLFRKKSTISLMSSISLPGGSGVRSDVDIPSVDGVFYKVRGLPEIQFIHEIGAMVVHGPDADTEQLGHLPG